MSILQFRKKGIDRFQGTHPSRFDVSLRARSGREIDPLSISKLSSSRSEEMGRYEEEADKVARSVAYGISSPIGSACQTRCAIASNPQDGFVPSGRGRPLEPDIKAFMEARFGHSFEGVRIHADATAARSARDMGAHAMTIGSDIVFGEGQYAPSNANGRRLLAHELTHVIQQEGQVAVQMESAGGFPDCCRDILERIQGLVTSFGVAISLLAVAPILSLADHPVHAAVTLLASNPNIYGQALTSLGAIQRREVLTQIEIHLAQHMVRGRRDLVRFWELMHQRWSAQPSAGQAGP